MSTENLFKESNREGSLGDVLALMCQNIGLTLVNSPSLSERVCNPCALKRNLRRLYNEIQAVTTSREEAEVNSPLRSKRQLPTSVCSPDNFFQLHSRKEQLKNKTPSKTSRHDSVNIFSVN